MKKFVGWMPFSSDGRLFTGRFFREEEDMALFLNNIPPNIQTAFGVKPRRVEVTVEEDDHAVG